MAKSFFERLTGSSQKEDIGLAEDLGESPRRKRANFSGISRDKQPDSDSEERSVIHPAAETGDTLPVEEEAGEEGQLTVDIYDDGANIVIQSTVAGVKPEDIDISLQEDTLTIRGSRKRHHEVEEGNFYYRELYWGSFSRSIILPEEVEFQKADAAMRNGLLTIRLPKKDKGEKKIKVKVD